VSTPRRNSRPPRLQGLQGHPPDDQPIQSDTGSLDPKSSKTSQFSVIRRFIGIESHASESYYLSYTVATSGVNRLASQICHNRLFRKKLQQNILRMISTEVSSLAAHNTIKTSFPDLILHIVPHRPLAQHTAQHTPHIWPQTLLRGRRVNLTAVRYRLQTVDVDACCLAFQFAHRRIPNRRIPLRNAIRSDPQDAKFPARLHLARSMVD
jgi:hypothetical protein